VALYLRKLSSHLTIQIEDGFIFITVGYKKKPVVTSSVPAVPVQLTTVTTPEDESSDDEIVATVNTSHSIEKYPEDN
jgi:hypothetical protein